MAEVSRRVGWEGPDPILKEKLQKYSGVSIKVASVWNKKTLLDKGDVLYSFGEGHVGPVSSGAILLQE